MFLISASKQPGMPHFARAIKGIKDWIRIGLALRTLPLQHVEPKLFINLGHPEDELELYTPVEEQDLDHIVRLPCYTDQVTSYIVHAVCKMDKSCNLNLLPGTPQTH